MPHAVRQGMRSAFEPNLGSVLTVCCWLLRTAKDYLRTIGEDYGLDLALVTTVQAQKVVQFIQKFVAIPPVVGCDPPPNYKPQHHHCPEQVADAKAKPTSPGLLFVHAGIVGGGGGEY
jgi:hypothetical protein